jgi:hypothetical protein
MRLVGQYLDAETIEPADLVILLQAHIDSLPTSPQARELVEAATRLSKRVRTYERQVKAAQASHDAALVTEGTLLEELPAAPPHRQIRARSVQRYSGLSKESLR